jgi:hypothetical protein
MTGENTPEPQGWDRTFKQMYDGWFAPEIERRREAGLLVEPFHLHIAQALFPPEGASRVLLNEEVRGTAKVQANRPIEKGDQVLSTDLELIEKYELPDELLDYGHFTIIRTGQRWGMFFKGSIYLLDPI